MTRASLGSFVGSFAVLVTLAVPAIGEAQVTAAAAAPAGPALPATVTLPEVLTLLEQRSPRTIADRATVAVAAADRITARTLPNPSVSYGGTHLVSGLSTGAVTQHQAVVEQPLLIFGQRTARLNAADLTVAAEEARVAEALAARRLLVRQAFATLVSRQEQLRVTQSSLIDLERVERVVQGRATAGDRSRYDVIRIETEAAMLRVAVTNSETDVTDASGQLATLLGFPGWSPRADGELDASPEVPADLELLWTIATRRKPAFISIRQQQASARGGLFLAGRERLPVPAVSGGVQTTQDVHGTSAFVGLSVPLPFFDRGQGAIARATAQLDAETQALDAALAETRADMERSLAVLNRRKAALAAFESTVGQQLPTLRQMAEDAYREGAADILELLDAMRSLKDIEVTRVQQRESVKLAEEQLVSVAGLDAPEPR